MHRIYVSTLKRAHRDETDETTGRLWILDWESRQVEMSRSFPVSKQTPGTGHSFGLRGITWWEGALVVARTDENIMFLDPDSLSQRCVWESPAEINHIHQLKTHNDVLWIVSTANNRLYGWKNGGIVATTKLSTARRWLDPHVPNVTHIRSRTWGADRAHFNSVAWHPRTGDEYHCYANLSMIFNWTQQQPVWIGAPLGMPHDIVFLPDGRFVVNSSAYRTAYVFEPTGNAVQPRLILELPGAEFDGWSMPGWLRGGGYSEATDTLVLTATPGTLHAFRGRTLEPLGSLEFSQDPTESPYDLVLDPRDW